LVAFLFYFDVAVVVPDAPLDGETVNAASIGLEMAERINAAIYQRNPSQS
jgi:hypothetical protein